MKRVLRTWIDRVAAWSGTTRHFEGRMRGSLTVLMYHRVLPREACRNYPLASLVMPASAFAEQARALARRFDVRPLGEALAALGRGEGVSRPLVSVTFDDGYRDNAAIAAPLLESAGIRGTFFVTTGFIESGRPMWFDEACLLLGALAPARAGELFERAAGRPAGPGNSIAAWMASLKSLAPAKREEVLSSWRDAVPAQDPGGYLPMTVSDLRAMRAAGHEIGSHTHSHAILTKCDDAQVARELAESRAHLSDWLDEEVAGFCYPNGDHDDRVRAATRTAGYSWACGTNSGAHRSGDDPFAIRRLDVTRRNVLDAGDPPDPAAFRAEVSRLHERMRRAASRGARASGDAPV